MDYAAPCRGWAAVCAIALAMAGCGHLDEPEVAPDRPVATVDAGKGVKARKEEGRVAKARRTKAPPGSVPEVDAAEIDGELAGGIDGLIGAKGTQFGAGGMSARGSGLGGGGSAEGLGGLGTRGAGSGRSGYGGGGGSFGAHGLSGSVSLGAPAPSGPPHRVAAVSKDVHDPGHNPTENAARDFLSTFSIDVDTGAYTQARRVIRSGMLPAPASVRTEEFVNYLDYHYPQPERGVPFSITMEAAQHPWRRGHHVLRVGIQGADPIERDREPVHLTFLVDTSCSMSGADRLPMAQRALHHLVENLEARDTVAIATYAGGTARILEPTPARQRDRILDAIAGLRSGGGTAMGSGMHLAYAMAEQAFVEGQENRVLVLSDGDANIGATGHDAMLASIADYARRGITMSTVGFGTGNYRDAMMEQLADKGDGNYVYIDSDAEARRVFGEDLLATIQTIARDVKIQVAFDPSDVVTYTLIGYENRAIADEDFRNDAVDAGEVGAGHTVTALYDLVLRDDLDGEIATVQVRYQPPGPEAPASEVAVAMPAAAVHQGFASATPDLRLAFGMASFAEKLRGAEAMAEISWTAIEDLVRQGLRGGTTRDDELLELIEAVDRMTAQNAAYEVDPEVSVSTAPQAVIRPTAAQPKIVGALQRSAVEAVLQRHRNQLQYCYQRELTRHPALAGQLVVKFTVAQDGTVASASTTASTLGSEAVQRCVEGRFMRMQFPQPDGGGIVIVSYPLAFSPG